MEMLDTRIKTSYIVNSPDQKLMVNAEDNRILMINFFQCDYDQLCKCPEGMKWMITSEKWVTGMHDKGIAVHNDCPECGKETNDFGHCPSVSC